MVHVASPRLDFAPTRHISTHPAYRPPAVPFPTRIGKRAVDVVAGLVLCLLAVPVVAVLAAVLAVQLRANPFFVHDRIGHKGRFVRIPKLRTLSPDTPAYADKTELELRPPTRVATALRVLHLDELPQLFLVPLGHLSLVGPRPRMAPEAAAHGDGYFELVRTSVPQGCTGLWQVSIGGSERVSDHPEFDHFYVEHQTLRLDLWILWRTVRQLVGGPPVDVDDIPRWTTRRARAGAPVLQPS